MNKVTLKHIIIFVFTLFLCSYNAKAIIPQVVQYEYTDKAGFLLSSKSGIEISDARLWEVARKFAESVQRVVGYDIGKTDRMKNKIYMAIDETKEREEYYINVSPKKITIIGGSAEAIDHAMYTLWQDACYDQNGTLSWKVSIIEDKPMTDKRLIKVNKSDWLDNLNIYSFFKYNGVAIDYDSFCFTMEKYGLKHIKNKLKEHYIDIYILAQETESFDRIVRYTDSINVNLIIYTDTNTNNKTTVNTYFVHQIIDVKNIECKIYFLNQQNTGELYTHSIYSTKDVFYNSALPVYDCIMIDVHEADISLLSEIVWTCRELKDYNDFCIREQEYDALLQNIKFKRIIGL